MNDIPNILKYFYCDDEIIRLLARRSPIFDWQDKDLQRRIVSLEKLMRKAKKDNRAIGEYPIVMYDKLRELWQMRENQRPSWNGVRRLPSVTTAE